MLHRLFLLLFFVGGGYWAFRWLRANGIRLLRQRHRLLDMGTLRLLSRQAHQTHSLRKALELRRKIWEASEQRPDRKALRERVDAAIRRLSEQEKIRHRIDEALRGAETTVGADTFTPSDVQALEDRTAMLSRLAEQARVLGQQGERTVLQLSNIHLALLDVSASESVVAGGALSDALADLETASTSARQQAEAEAEVDRFLHAQHQRHLDS